MKIIIGVNNISLFFQKGLGIIIAHCLLPHQVCDHERRRSGNASETVYKYATCPAGLFDLFKHGIEQVQYFLALII